MRLSFVIFLSLLTAACHTPKPTATATTLNLRLKRELDSIEVVDQRYRLLVMSNRPAQLDSVARAAGITREQVGPHLSQRMIEQDSSNLTRVRSIISQYGYPGKTLVGESTSEVALLVIQHSGRIPQYIGLVKQMADQGEVPFHLYARMLDRHLVQQNKAQVYGTQGVGYTIPNPATGQPEWVRFIWPIEDAAQVNERRRKAGFDSTVEANAQRLGIEYKPMTLAEALHLQRATKAGAAGRP